MDIQYAQEDPNPGPTQVSTCEFKNGRSFELSNMDNLAPEILENLESGFDVLTIPRALLTNRKIRIPRGAAVRRQRLGNWREWIPGNDVSRNIFNRGNLGNSGNRRLQSDTTGTYTVLVVRVIAPDGETTDSLDRLSDSVFGNGNDPVTLASQYSACSYGQLNFVKADDKSSTNSSIASNITNGVVEVMVSSATSAGDETMREEIKSLLKTAFDVSNAGSLADHVMFCLPPGTMAGIACK